MTYLAVSSAAADINRMDFHDRVGVSNLGLMVRL
jgi:hypothetical protein